eukprot:s1007_g4.t1
MAFLARAILVEVKAAELRVQPAKKSHACTSVGGWMHLLFARSWLPPKTTWFVEEECQVTTQHTTIFVLLALKLTPNSKA